MRLSRWILAGWVRGGLLPFALVVFLAEMMVIAPLRGVSWALVLERLPDLLAGGAALAAFLVCLARWGRSERRAFLEVLPLEKGRILAAETLTDLLVVLLWGATWPLLIPARPEHAWLCLATHLWGGAAGAWAARAPRFPAAAAAALAAGALGPRLASWRWEALAAAAGAAWLPLFVLRPSFRPASTRVSVSAWQDPSTWLSFRLPLPGRGLAAFLLRGNLPLGIALGISVAFAAHVGWGSRHFGGGFRPEPVALLLAVGLGVPLAVGLGASQREFLLTRPLSRLRLVGAAFALALPFVVLLPVAGVFGLSRTTDQALGEQMDQVGFWEMRKLDPLGGWAEGDAEKKRRVEAALRRETGLWDMRFGEAVSRPVMIAAARRHRLGLWAAAGLLALAWFAGGLWIRMRQYANLEGIEAGPGARREAAWVLLALLLLTATQLGRFGAAAVPGSLSLAGLLLATLGVLGASWVRLGRLEVA